jgi:hypothetical protein
LRATPNGGSIENHHSFPAEWGDKESRGRIYHIETSQIRESARVHLKWSQPERNWPMTNISLVQMGRIQSRSHALAKDQSMMSSISYHVQTRQMMRSSEWIRIVRDG